MNYEDSKKLFKNQFKEDVVFIGGAKKNDVLLESKMFGKFCESKGISVKYLVDGKEEISSYNSDFAEFALFLSLQLLPVAIDLLKEYIKITYIERKSDATIKSKFVIKQNETETFIEHEVEGDANTVLKAIEGYSK